MTNEQINFLGLQTPPARLDAKEAAWYLGFAPHEIPILVRASLLKPLGRPAPSSVKHFATVTLNQLRHDTNWLARASDAVTKHWQMKNARKSEPHHGHPEPGTILRNTGNSPATR